MQASLTGHLVLTTLHTNDAIGALSRMIDMGVEPYLLASALAGVALFAGHLGTMGSRLGVPVTELTGDRLWRAGVAALGGLVLLAAGLWLERACRVPEDDDAV